MLESLGNQQLLEWYKLEEIQQLSDILVSLHEGLGDKIGSMRSIEMCIDHTVSHPRRYYSGKSVVYGDDNPEIRDMIFSGQPSWIDYSVGGGRGLENFLRPSMALRFWENGLKLTVSDIQMSIVEDGLRDKFDFLRPFHVYTEYKQSDLRDPPKIHGNKYNLGIIGFTHFYLSPEEYDLAIAYRLAECDVLFITPITKEHSGGTVLDGIFISRDSKGNIQGYNTEACVG